MTAAKTVTKNLPPWAQGFSSKLDLMGVEWVFLEQYHLMDLGKHVQVRDEEDLAPQGKVAEYTERMRAGDQFPPVVITADDYVVDGATRTLAAHAAGRKYFPVLKLKTMTYEGALASDVERLVTIGSVFNKHGKEMSAKSWARVIEWVASVKGTNATAEDIANQLQVKRSLVRAVLTARDGRQRAEGLGVNLARRKLSQTHLVNLGTASRNLNDVPFHALAELTVTTTMSTPEQQAIMNRLNACRNDADRMSILMTEKESRKITSLGVNQRPPISAQLRQHLGFILKQGTVQSGELLVETASLKAGNDQFKLIDQAIEILRKTRGLQFAKNEKLLELENQSAAEIAASLSPSFSG